MGKIVSITIIFVLVFSCVTAQKVNLTGKIESPQQEPLEFITVSLLKNDSIPLHGTMTDSLGIFSFKVDHGNYTLKLEQFGQELLKKKIQLQTSTSLGILKINQSVMLDGVLVESRKKLVERKVDRLVFNVENSIASQGMSALEALRNTPLVRVQNEGVSIVGKGNVLLMINDRVLNISESELTSYLQSLRSDDIAKIEIITTPPSKYEAQGNSGIINIVLKKNRNLGWSGNVNGSYQKTTYYGFGFGATVNYQSRKIATSLKLRQYDYSSKPIGTRNLIGQENSVYTSETRKNNSNAVGLNYSLDYKINKSQNIGLIYDFNSSHYTIDANGMSRYEHSEVIDSTLSTLQKQRWETPTHTLTVYYDIKLDTIGKKISIIGNYLSNIPDKVNDFKTLNTTTGNEIVVRNSSYTDYTIYSGQADLTFPYQFGTIEAGTKGLLLNKLTTFVAIL